MQREELNNIFYFNTCGTNKGSSIADARGLPVFPFWHLGQIYVHYFTPNTTLIENINGLTTLGSGHIILAEGKWGVGKIWSATWTKIRPPPLAHEKKSKPPWAHKNFTPPPWTHILYSQIHFFFLFLFFNENILFMTFIKNDCLWSMTHNSPLFSLKKHSSFPLGNSKIHSPQKKISSLPYPPPALYSSSRR